MLSSVPLRSSSWDEVLAGTNLQVPLQHVTLQDVFELDPPPPKLDELTLADIDLNATPLRDASLAALLLAPRPLDSLPPPAGGWCAFLAGQPRDCAGGADPSRDSLLTLELTGDDFGPYFAEPISVAGIDLGGDADRATLARIRLADVDLSLTPFGALPASELGGLLACNPTCTGTVAGQQKADPEGFSSATLGELSASLPLPSLPDASLGQVLAGLVPAGEIPYERAPLGDLLSAAGLRKSSLQTYRVGFAIDCALADGLRVGVDVPEGARILPHSGRVRQAGPGGRSTTLFRVPPPTADPTLEDVPTFRLRRVCRPRHANNVLPVTLDFRVEPSHLLGPAQARVLLRTNSTAQAVEATQTVLVNDSLDADDTVEGRRTLTPGRILTGHIAGVGDVDTYTLSSLPTGARVTVALTHVPADYDLQIFGPDTGIETAPLRSSPLRSSPLRSSALPDAGREPNIDASVVAPDSVQDLPLRSSPLRSSSINRGIADESGTFIVRESDAGKDFTVVVSGFNGASDPRPYSLRVSITPSSPELPCDTRSLQNGDAGSLPASVPRSTQTLILVNQRRLEARFGAAKAGAVVARLATFAQRSDVEGVVVPVDGDPDVDAAYEAWDADPCSSNAANRVVERINALVDRLRGPLTNLRFLTIVGADEIVPQARVPDFTVLANEREYADEASFGGKDNAQSRSLRDGYLLSDDPYGDFDPQARLGTDLFVPDVGMGRVIETPDEILAQLDRFAQFDGRLAPQTSFVTGYDFISDGAKSIFDALAPATPQAGTLLNDETKANWDETDALAGLNGATPRFASINAHYDHFQALPAAAFNNDGSPNLLRADQATPAPGSILFNIGCHSGYNASDAVVSFAGERSAALGDWAQVLTRDGSVYTGNTGFGYGDTEVVAYSERLMTQFAANLATGTMAVGQALMFAKQSYAAGLGVGDDYDAKVLVEATTYGLPMFRLGPNGRVAPPALPLDQQKPDEVRLRSAPFEATPQFVRRDGERGSYWEVAGHEPVVVQRHPVQPRVSLEVTAEDGLPVHGAIPEEIRTVEVAGVDPVYPLPTIDLAAYEPEPQVDGMTFPAATHSITSESTPGGRRDRLDLFLGQFRDDEPGGDGSGHQILITRIAGRVYRSNSLDWAPPTIVRADGVVIGEGVTFSVETAEADAVAGTILFQTDADDTWHLLQMRSIAGKRLSAASILPPGATAVRSARVYVRDEAGNVGQAQNKGFGHVARPLPPPGVGDPRVVLEPEIPATGFFTEASGTPRVSLDPGEHAGATFEYRIDDRPYVRYDGGSFAVEGEGAHVVEFRGSDGSGAIAIVAIDTEGPILTGGPTRSPNAAGWYSAPVTIQFVCADFVSGLAPGGCPEDVSITTEGRNRSTTRTAADRAGNSTSLTVGGIDLDLTAPEVRIDQPTGGFLVGAAGARLTGDATDNLSGVDNVVVTYTRQNAGAETIQRKADLVCNGSRTSCEWSVPPPPAGQWKAVARATDIAGHIRDSEAVFFSITPA